jgi:hypothetical protein
VWWWSRKNNKEDKGEKWGEWNGSEVVEESMKVGKRKNIKWKIWKGSWVLWVIKYGVYYVKLWGRWRNK